MQTPADKMSINIIDNFYGYRVAMLDQIAANDGEYGTVISDDEVYILSTSDRPIKGVISEDFDFTQEFIDNADLSSNTKILASYGFAAITNAVAGKMIFS